MTIKRKWFSGFVKQLITFAFFFAIGLGAVAFGQYELITWEGYQSEAQDLHNTVKDVSDNLFSKHHWNLEWYRQWDNREPSSFLVISGTRQLVDSNDADATDLIRSAVPVDKYLKPKPAYVTTDYGEKWLLDDKPIAGGDVIGGISSTDLIGLRAPDKLIEHELAKYGKTLNSAENVNGTSIRNYMSGVMVVEDSGDLTSSTAGTVPLKVELLAPDNLLDGRVHSFSSSGKYYELLASRIKAPSATILAFDSLDTSQSLKNLRYSLFIAAGAWILAIVGFSSFGIRGRLRQAKFDSSLEISTRQLIAQGENSPVEFKSTLRRNLVTGNDDVKIEGAVLKTIAAFLNTDGGTLLVGISDDRRIMGLGADGFASADKAMLHLTNLIRGRIGSQSAAYVKMRIEVMDNGLEILRVDCRRSAIPA